jgi:hypothetical protein
MAFSRKILGSALVKFIGQTKPSLPLLPLCAITVGEAR